MFGDTHARWRLLSTRVSLCITAPLARGEMSVRLMTLVWQIECPMGDKIVLLKMADCANDRGESIFPTKANVARECGCSQKHVQNVWSKYRGSGLLKCERAVGGKGRPTVYAFDLERLKGEPIAPYTMPKGERDTRNTVPPLLQREQMTDSKGATGSSKGANDGNPPAPPIRINHQEPSLTVRKRGVGEKPVLVEIADDLLPPLDTPEFRSTWQRWKDYRREIRHPLKPTTVALQLKALSKYGAEAATAMLEEAMEKGWQGYVVPEKRYGRRNGGPPKTFAESVEENLRLLGGTA